MAAFCLADLGRNVVRVGAHGRITITNTSDGEVAVYVDRKDGGSWSPFSGRVTLRAGASWSACHADLRHDMVRVVARGKEDGQNLVRVEY